MEPTTTLHMCEVRTIDTDERACSRPGRLYLVYGEIERWICDEHAPSFTPEAVLAR